VRHCLFAGCSWVLIQLLVLPAHATASAWVPAGLQRLLCHSQQSAVLLLQQHQLPAALLWQQIGLLWQLQASQHALAHLQQGQQHQLQQSLLLGLLLLLLLLPVQPCWEQAARPLATHQLLQLLLHPAVQSQGPLHHWKPLHSPGALHQPSLLLLLLMVPLDSLRLLLLVLLLVVSSSCP
jgi:hypothetical protein